MKKKGFTLIELMGVIVLIGVIAVIAVPVVKETIKSSRQKSYDRQVDFIIKSAKNWSTTNTDLLPDTGSILVTLETLKREGFLENKNIRNPIDNEQMNGSVVVTYNENYNQYEYEYSDEVEGMKALSSLVTTSHEVTSIPSCIKDGGCTAGTPLAIKVNDSKVYNFYVIKDDGNKVTLIMDRNLRKQQAWASEVDYGCGAIGSQCSLNDKGPITILNYLTSQIATDNWENIPAITSYEYINNKNGTTNQYGYQKLVITNGAGVLTSQDGNVTNLTGTMRARLLTEEEVNWLITNNNGTTPGWLTYNLSSSNSQLPYGYWFLTANSSSVIHGRIMSYSGIIYVHDVHYATADGARPVITIPRYGDIY